MGSTKLLWLNFKFDFDLLGGQRYLLPFVWLEEAAIPQNIGSTSDTDSLRKFLSKNITKVNMIIMRSNNYYLFKITLWQEPSYIIYELFIIIYIYNYIYILYIIHYILTGLHWVITIKLEWLVRKIKGHRGARRLAHILTAGRDGSEGTARL